MENGLQRLPAQAKGPGIQKEPKLWSMKDLTMGVGVGGGEGCEGPEALCIPQLHEAKGLDTGTQPALPGIYLQNPHSLLCHEGDLGRART